MSIKVALNHKTTYIYDKPVGLFPHVIRLRPAPHTRTTIQAYSLRVKPENHFLNWQQDPFGNYQARYVFNEKTTLFDIEVDLVADMAVINPFDFFLEPDAEKFPFQYDKQLLSELGPNLHIKENGARLNRYISRIDLTPRRTIDFLVDLNQMLLNDVQYIIRMEPGIQTCEETLALKKGSCRDSGWLLVQILRHLGFAARFVSGYLIQLVADVKPIDGPAGTDKDFTDLHAWAEVFLPGAGWVGLDPTSGLFADEGHIPLACTPDPMSAAPVTGAVDPAQVKFEFSMSVKRLKEQPRSTKPFTDEDWKKIYTLGEKVDQDLKRMDVRLTMGGEPTFVAVDNMDGDEWNIAALGPTKKIYAEDLFKRLKDRFSFGPLLHYGQGKWYPGESLPRWALSCYWRRDGIPIWRNQSLYADERTNLGYTKLDCSKFISTLAMNLSITDRFILPGYEDVYYYLWKEGTLPVNVDPFAKNLKDSEERNTLRKVLEQGLGTVVGYALPLEWNVFTNSWKTCPWFLRRERLYLIPGDSPMGYRLPINSIPHSSTYRYEENPSTFEKRFPLEDYHYKAMQRKQNVIMKASSGETGKDIEEYPDLSKFLNDDNVDPNLVRSALCVEPRNGNIYIFVPPVVRLEQYLDLISAIEITAQELNVKVIIEGYQPPWDSRIEKFQITPDPGVIEVNVQPAYSWKEMVRNTEILYEEAKWARLAAEKFMMDGKHTGTGGGNHVTLGGPSPQDSPLLRSPALLKSIITYWQNHPSLSYLFSGLFLGPTSQAPRIDEARHENMNEIEIAFKELTKNSYTPLWLVDRLFRNLLTDLTGNTHRAEFCIDKLYSPDSSTGRLGLVELRGFEMPPHYRMSTVQMLLIRALIAKFWEKPLDRKLARYGTELHDKYMLPHFLWEDFKDVLQDLAENNYEFSEEWFKAFLDFRFPIYGKTISGDIQLEIRMAAEPWLVLGEEGAPGGTARYVDSSLERVQVRAFGLTSNRYVIACNRVKVPLQPTGTNGEYVAGIRYRAWQPPSALHPTIGVHTPLVFDIIDTWNKKSIGGCTYHVSHPGGRLYVTFPVNANEAETRRFSRFYDFGHNPGEVDLYPYAPPENLNPEFPYTLDLRKIG